jgi:hypothetical protein
MIDKNRRDDIQLLGANEGRLEGSNPVANEEVTTV